MFRSSVARQFTRSGQSVCRSAAAVATAIGGASKRPRRQRKVSAWNDRLAGGATTSSSRSAPWPTRPSPAGRGRAPRAGNAVRLLKDGAENYPAWLEAIASARETVHFESYIVHDDAVGLRFADALIAQREGRRPRPPHLRLDGRPDHDEQPFLAAAARGRGRGAPLQPAAPRRAAGVDRARPSEVDRGGRPRRLRHRALHRQATGRAGRSAAWPPGATRASRSTARRWPTWRKAFAEAWAACGPTRSRPEDEDSPAAPAAGRRRRPARGRDRPETAGLSRLDPLIAALAREHVVADRRLLRGHSHLRAGPARRRARRRRRPPAGAGPGQRHRDHAAALARRLPAAAGGGGARLRMERADAARQDRGRGRALGAGGLDQPQPRRAGWATGSSTWSWRTSTFGRAMEAMYSEDLDQRDGDPARAAPEGSAPSTPGARPGGAARAAAPRGPPPAPSASATRSAGRSPTSGCSSRPRPGWSSSPASGASPRHSCSPASRRRSRGRPSWSWAGSVSPRCIAPSPSGVRAVARRSRLPHRPALQGPEPFTRDARLPAGKVALHCRPASTALEPAS